MVKGCRELGTGRTGGQVLNRWNDHIDQESVDSKKEDTKIIEHVKGSRGKPGWAVLERELSEDRRSRGEEKYRRPANKIKNHWNNHLK